MNCSQVSSWMQVSVRKVHLHAQVLKAGHETGKHRPYFFAPRMGKRGKWGPVPEAKKHLFKPIERLGFSRPTAKLG